MVFPNILLCMYGQTQRAKLRAFSCFCWNVITYRKTVGSNLNAPCLQCKLKEPFCVVCWLVSTWMGTPTFSSIIQHEVFIKDGGGNSIHSVNHHGMEKFGPIMDWENCRIWLVIFTSVPKEESCVLLRCESCPCGFCIHGAHWGDIHWGTSCLSWDKRSLGKRLKQFCWNSAIEFHSLLWNCTRKKFKKSSPTQKLGKSDYLNFALSQISPIQKMQV